MSTPSSSVAHPLADNTESVSIQLSILLINAFKKAVKPGVLVLFHFTRLVLNHLHYNCQAAACLLCCFRFYTKTRWLWGGVKGQNEPGWRSCQYINSLGGVSVRGWLPELPVLAHISIPIPVLLKARGNRWCLRHRFGCSRIGKP